MFDDGKLRQLLTHHGSVVFLDVGSGELRHGQAASSPRNVFLGPRDGTWYLVHAPADGGLREIRLPPGLTPTSVQLRDSPSDWPQAWSLAPAEGGVFGLLSDGLFLCAEDNGRVTLSRPGLGAWERFELAESPAPQAVISAARDCGPRCAHFLSPEEAASPRILPGGKSQPGCARSAVCGKDPTDVVSTAPSDTIRGLTIVVRDAKYVSHYFHFMEILIRGVCFSNAVISGTFRGGSSCGGIRVAGLEQSAPERCPEEPVNGGVWRHTDLKATPYFARCSSLEMSSASIDWSVTRINKFLEPLLPGTVWMPELRRRIHLATQAALRQAPQLASDVRCSYINRKPPPALTEPVKMRLLDILRDRFGAVREIDFADISWAERREAFGAARPAGRCARQWTHGSPLATGACRRDRNIPKDLTPTIIR